MINATASFPKQKLPFKSKGKDWRKSVLDWASSKTYFNYSPVRTNVVHMKTNYDLVNGIIHMEDVTRILNPGDIATSFLPEKIQHYPIINSKLNTLRGEEAARVFDWKVTVTNPYAVSQIEENKKKEFDAMVQQIVEDDSIDDQQAEQQMREGSEFFDFTWQDLREIRANELLKHYQKEQDYSQIFNDGFMDAAVVGTEAYLTSIVGGEPHLQRLNPMKLRVFRSGYSDRLEDADVIIYEDYWNPGRVVDTFYDELPERTIKWLSEDIPEYGGQGPVGAAGNYNEAYGFINTSIIGEDGLMVEGDAFGEIFDAVSHLDGGIGSDLLPYDVAGNIRVVRIWWKSFRKIFKVKSFDPETGEEVFDFYPETYIADKSKGEEAEPLWIMQAWEGTRIGEDTDVCVRPCLVQYNSISNPSRCNFGIIGTIYNLNESKPYSLVDMMKPYNYLYDAVHAKLVDMIATNWGKLVELDLAMKPKDWKVEQWMYFARVNKVLIKDSFREGDKGAALGKIAGGLNNASKGYIDADWGQSIQNYLNILQWTKDAMSDLVGINRQREGQTYNRETVGGIERAVMQSSYITDWLFKKHENTKKRVLESILEQAKAALKGRSKKFEYILSNGSIKMMEINGDEFCECDYGLVVDNSQDIQRFNQQLETISQAAIQNGAMDFPSIMRLYSSASTSEKIRIIEASQRRMEQRQQEMAQQQQQAEMQKIQAEMQMKQLDLELKEKIAQLDSQTRIQVAEINSKAEELRLGIYEAQNNIDLRNRELDIEERKLQEEIRQFDKELRQDDKELDQKKEIEMKKIAAQKEIAKMKPKTTSNTK